MFLIYPHDCLVQYMTDDEFGLVSRHCYTWRFNQDINYTGKANEEYLIGNICQNCLKKCFFGFLGKYSKFPKYKWFFGSISLLGDRACESMWSGVSQSLKPIPCEMTMPGQRGQMLPYRLEGVNHHWVCLCHCAVVPGVYHHARMCAMHARTIPDHNGPSLRFLELIVPPKGSGGLEVKSVCHMCQMAQNYCVMMVVHFLPFMWWPQGCG